MARLGALSPGELCSRRPRDPSACWICGDEKMNCSAIPVSEACVRLGISRSKLYELLNEGEVPSVKIGRRRLIRVADLNQWLSSLPLQTPAEGQTP
jgi:excisionase family DNA binding protein